MGNGETKSRKSGKPSSRDESVKLIESNTILLLGCGDAGKTTLRNRFRLDYYKDRASAKALQEVEAELSVCLMIKQYILSLIESVEKKHESKIPKELLALLNQLQTMLPKFEKLPMPKDLHRSIEEFLSFEQVETEFKVQFETMDYFLAKLASLTEKGAKVSDADFLRLKARTTGVISETFVVKGNKEVKVVDVGGERSERRKWERFFPGVDVVIFLVNASEHDMNLYEDDSRNRMEESLEVFENTVNRKDLKDAHFVLLFNKIDLLKENQSELLTNFEKRFLEKVHSNVEIHSQCVSLFDDDSYRQVNQHLSALLNLSSN